MEKEDLDLTQNVEKAPLDESEIKAAKAVLDQAGVEPVKPEKAKDVLNSDIDALANQLHEAWRAPRLKDDGTYEKREKITTDQAWIDAHGGQTIVDIANTSYMDLPADWQEENKASAEVSLRAMYPIAFYGEGQYGDRDFLKIPGNIERISETIHDEWRNRKVQEGYKVGDENWAWANSLMVPYSQLPEQEKAKDRDIAIATAELLKAKMDKGELEVPEELVKEWLAADADYLTGVGEFGWKVNPLETSSYDDGTTQLRLEVPADNININGKFKTTDVAKFLRIIRNNTPGESDDSHNSFYFEARTKAYSDILTKEIK